VSKLLTEDQIEHCVKREKLKAYFIEGINANMFSKVLNSLEAQTLYSMFKGHYFKAKLFK